MVPAGHATSSVLDVAPRVRPVATTLTAKRSCSTAPHLQLGQPSGSFGAGATFVDVVPDVDEHGAWVLQFAMPPLPATAVLNCPDVPTSTVIPIAPSSEPAGFTAHRDVDGYVITVAKRSQPDLLEVFTAAGDPVASRK